MANLVKWLNNGQRRTSALLLLTFVIVSTAILFSTALAQSSKGTNAHARQLAKTEQSLIATAQDLAIYETQLHLLAAERATDGRLKILSRQLLQDSEESNVRLRLLADYKSGPVSDRLSPQNAQQLDKLRRTADGSDFDRRYVLQLTQAQDRATFLYRSSLSRTGDPDLRDYASSELPNLSRSMLMLEGISSDI